MTYAVLFSIFKQFFSKNKKSLTRKSINWSGISLVDKKKKIPTNLYL